MRKFFVLTVIAMSVTAASITASALEGFKGNDATAEVATLLKTKTDAVLSVLKETGLSKDEKESRIMEIIEPVIDFDLMAKLALGKRHWGKLSPDQQKEFVKLFVKRLKESYLDKTTLYSDQKVTYEKPVLKGNRVYAVMNIITTDDKTPVLYKFYKSRDAWKVYDIEVDGVSFVRSYRAQFDTILQDGTVDDLFAQLRKPVKGGEQ
ncbi:MAG: hypothetical protein B5M56_03540 [Desulfococcus sp. 4484_241]|nr:MAG: hypothetical protein B5M56_03540 [Desulfococcus sp. 4484_241]